MSKFYAIREGKINNVILTDWEDCKKLVHGVKAVYKSFNTLEEAQSFLSQDKKETVYGQSEVEEDEDTAVCFVDGSYNEKTGLFGYGFIILNKGLIVDLGSGAAQDSKYKNERQIPGELRAAMSAIYHSSNMKFKNIIIYHDYMGVANTATGTWKAKSTTSKMYKDFYDFYVDRYNLKITFKHVKGHTNNLYNEIVDRLSKHKIGVPFTPDLDNMNDEIRIKKSHLRKNLLKEIIKDKDRVIEC